MSTEGPTSEVENTNDQTIGVSDAAVEEDSPTVMSTLQKLKEGRLSAKSLGTQSRRACIEYLDAEAHTVPEMAEILKVSERTVIRDRNAIRSNRALKPDPKFAAEIAGEVLHQAELARSRIHRAARDKAASPTDRIEAGRAVWQVTREMVEALQRMGYLPSAAQQINATLTHQVPEAFSLDMVQKEILRVEQAIPADDPASSDIRSRIGKVKQELLAAKSVQELQSIQSTLETKENHDDRL